MRVLYNLVSKASSFNDNVNLSKFPTLVKASIGLNRAVAVVSILARNLYEPKIDVASHCALHNSWTLAPNAGNPNGYLLEPDFEIK